MIIPSKEMDYICQWVEYIGHTALVCLVFTWAIASINISAKIFLIRYLDADLLLQYHKFIEYCNISKDIAVCLSIFYLGLVMIPALTIISYGLMVKFIPPKIQPPFLISLFLVFSYYFRVWTWRKRLYQFMSTYWSDIIKEHNKNKHMCDMLDL